MNKTAAIAGATGSTGRHLLRMLLDSNCYQQVHVLHYYPIDIEHPKLVQHVLPFDELGKHQIEAHIDAEIDDVFCCLGTTQKIAQSKKKFIAVDKDYPIALAHWAVRHQARQMSVVSAMGANYNLPSLYIRTKYEMERGVAQAFLKGGFDSAPDKPSNNTPTRSLHFFRPSLLVDAQRKEHRAGEAFGATVLGGLTHIAPWLTKHFRETEVEQLAQIMFDTAQQATNKAFNAYSVADIHTKIQEICASPK